MAGPAVFQDLPDAPPRRSLTTRAYRGPEAMDAAKPDATTIKDETLVHSRAGFTPPTPAELAAHFPSLEVLELLGHGGMGLVYKGRQPLLDRLVAIKVIRPDFQTDDAFQERFLREARTLAKLRHPFIVTVFDVSKAEGLYGLVMEYVEGPSLRQLLDRGSITERDVLDFVPQITEALQHAHEAGVVHRDIKPENVLVDSHGRVRLVDFGLATLFGPEAQRRIADDDRVVGTLRYMAPEQISMPQAVDHRADIYSTGVVFYEMLARELPGPDRVPPSRKAATDPRFDPIVLRALERERDRRYQEARLMHLDVTNLARTPESTIRLEKHIPAPPEQVFATWTNPDQMADWYAPSDDFGPTTGEVDPRVGGQYRIGMLLPGRTDPRFVSGQYCRVDPPRTLSFTWAWEPHQAGWQETQVTVEFHPRGGGTDLVLTHERFRDEPDKNAHAQGWQGCLNRLGRKFRG
jgi:serine/threonine protein kinase